MPEGLAMAEAVLAKDEAASMLPAADRPSRPLLTATAPLVVRLPETVTKRLPETVELFKFKEPALLKKKFDGAALLTVKLAARV